MIRKVVGLCASLTLAGCASIVDPNVPFPPKPLESTNPNIGKTDLALVRVDDFRAKIEGYAHEQATFQFATNLGVLAGIGTAVVSAVFRGPPDLTAGAALFGGASSVTQRSFSPFGITEAYSSGIVALVCIRQAAEPGAVAIARVRGVRGRLVDALRELRARINEASGPSYVPTASLVAAIQVAITAEGKARIVLAGADGLLADDAALAAQVESAMTQVALKMRARTDAERLDAAAIANMARSIGEIGATGVERAKANTRAALGQSESEKSKAQKILEAGDADNGVIISELIGLAGVVDAIAKQVPESLAEQISKARTTLPTCGMADVTVEPLSLAQGEQVTIEPEKTTPFEIMGGKPLYYAALLNQPETKLFRIDRVSNGIFQVTGHEGLTNDQEFSVQIHDTSNPVKRLTVKIKAKVAAKK